MLPRQNIQKFKIKIFSAWKDMPGRSRIFFALKIDYVIIKKTGIGVMDYEILST